MKMIFLLDDSDDPGLARVELIKDKGMGPAGKRLWQIKVLEVIKPSFRRVRRGQLLTVNESLLKQGK